MRSIMLMVLSWMMVSVLSSCSTVNSFMGTKEYIPPPERHLQKLEDNRLQLHDSDLDGQAMNIIWNIDSDVRDQLVLSRDLKEGLTHYLKERGIQIKNPKDKKTQHLIVEIERARKNSSTLTGVGEQKVDYYVKGSITKSSLSSSYSDPYWCPSSICKEKRKGSCTYELESGLQIEVLSLPSLQRVKHFNVNDDENFSVDVFDRCVSYSTTAETENEYKKSRADIVDELVDCSGKSLASFLSPRAYIEKFFSDGDKHVFQISSGSAAGFKEGDSVQISRNSEVGYVQIGDAKVIATQEHKSYVEVSNRKLVDDIRLHDQVKVEYTDYTLGLDCLGSVKEH